MTPKHVGYQDDQYVGSTFKAFLIYEPYLLSALERDGHSLEPTKSQLWIPALDAVPTLEAPPQSQAAWSRYKRGQHGVKALGASADGRHETDIQPDGGIALTPVIARAQACHGLLDQLDAMLQAQTHEQTFHAVWTLLQSSCVRAFDYDARMVGAAKLHDTVVPVYERIDTVVAQILGGGSQ